MSSSASWSEFSPSLSSTKSWLCGGSSDWAGEGFWLVGSSGSATPLSAPGSVGVGSCRCCPTRDPCIVEVDGSTGLESGA